MTVIIETLVFCDGCEDNCSGDNRSEPSWIIRKLRKKVGWTRRGNKDYCKECTEKKRWEDVGRETR